MSDLVTPCHGTPLTICMTLEGSGYMQTEVPSEILCNARGCHNSWDASGVADPWNED